MSTDDKFTANPATWVKKAADKIHSLQTRIAELEAENAKLKKTVAIVQNAARNLDACRQAEAIPIRKSANDGRVAVATLDGERAANELLTDRVIELEAALKPFKKVGELLGPNDEWRIDMRGYAPNNDPEWFLCADDLRNAATAYRPESLRQVIDKMREAAEEAAE